MNRILSLLFVGLASTALFIACSDEESCLADSDCSDGQVCEAEVCRDSCTTDADCSEGACLPRSGAAGSYCDPDASPNNTNNTNNTNNINNTNNTNNVNNLDPQVYVALITDTSSGTDACDVTDPGSDIWAVELVNGSGANKGWGSLDYDGIIQEGNDFSIGLNLDGEAPGAIDMCPEFNADNVTALGCGGEIGVRFYNAGVPVLIEDGDQINIYEFGLPLCMTATAADTFVVDLCTDTDGVVNNEDTSSCTIDILGDSSGQVSGTVSF